MSRICFSLFIIASLVFAASVLGMGLGPPGGTIYAHDVPYATIATPKDLPNKGNFDTIYLLGGDLANVSNAAPGDRDYNGGRWEVRPITWISIAPMQFTNSEDILAAAADGDIEIGDVVRRFECPLIRKNR